MAMASEIRLRSTLIVDELWVALSKTLPVAERIGCIGSYGWHDDSYLRAPDQLYTSVCPQWMTFVVDMYGGHKVNVKVIPKAELHRHSL
jgi:hypothetical protein